MAARAAFAAASEVVSLAEISRRAGVGMATLYRNFPNRIDLLEALYAAEADAAFTPPDDIDGLGPGERLRAWLRQFYSFAAAKKHVGAELLMQVKSTSPIFDDTRTRVIAAGKPIFESAQQAGQVREDLTLEQVLQMLVSLSAVEGDAEYREPLFQTILDGLIPRAMSKGPG